MAFGEYIKGKREERGYTQRKLALAAGLGNSTISRIEGEGRIPDIATLTKLAKALRLPMEDLARAAGLAMPEESPKKKGAKIVCQSKEKPFIMRKIAGEGFPSAFFMCPYFLFRPLNAALCARFCVNPCVKPSGDSLQPCPASAPRGSDGKDPIRRFCSAYTGGRPHTR